MHPKLRNLYFISLKTFEELGVSEEIRRAITELGFESPMPVQEEVIPYLLGSNNDVIALAQTGTGKTAAFGIPVLQRLDPTSRDTQALILSPTRELCLQIADDLKDFSKYMNGINIVAVYGGTSIENQIRALRHGAQVIVATPGRLIDLMHRGKANLDKVYMDRLSGLLVEADFERIYSKVRLERGLLEEKRQALELRKNSPAPAEDRAKELVQRFVDSAFASREVLVSLIERVELTEEKQIIIKFRFREPEAIS